MYGICESFSPIDRVTFKKDFAELVHIFLGIKACYESDHKKGISCVPLFRENLLAFNKKYHALDVVLEEEDLTSDDLKFFLGKHQEFTTLFNESLRNMKNITGVGRNSLEAQNTKVAPHIMLGEITHKLFLGFSNTQMCILEKNDKHNRIQLITELDSLLDKTNPDLELCMYYALKDGIDKSVKLVFAKELKLISGFSKSKFARTGKMGWQ